jgi:tetraacyldisaccharide 4'-kinase
VIVVLVDISYRLLTLLLSPLLLLYLAVRVARDRRYRARLGERFGALPRSLRRTAPGAVWLHAVSVGEVMTAVPMIERLREAMPWAPVYVSVTTLAGRDLADRRLARLAAGVFYAPFDLAWAVRRVLRALKPALVVVMETEIWPNLYREAKRSGASLVVVNGRISDQASPSYQRWRAFFRVALARVDRILAQDETSARRYAALGAANVVSAGNLKFDFDPASTRVAPEIEWLLRDLAPAPVWIAASTMPPAREGEIDEDDLVVETFQRLAARFPQQLLIWAPRKPERFDAAAERLTRAGIAHLRRSRLREGATLALPGVLLVDTVGELAGLFRLGGAVFLGGTFPSRGGHNPLEPAAHGVAVVAGPHMENFAEIAAEFDSGEAWLRAAAPDELCAALAGLFDDRELRASIGARGRELAASKRGATARAIEELRRAYEDALPEPVPTLARRIALTPLTWLWRALVALDRARTRAVQAPCPVVSVGNLSVGGTGKTPFSIWLCARLRERGYEPGVALRGYRRATADRIVAAAGAPPDVARMGEEAALHLRAKHAAVAVGADRVASIRELLARGYADCAVLDDGFQHWRLRRDCDVVLVDALAPFGGLLPLGRLREDVAALRRSDAVVVTRARAGRDYAGLVRRIRAVNARVPISFARIVATLPERAPGRAGAFCGLGQPEAFRETLSELGYTGAALDWFEAFPDHHHYTEDEVDALLARAPALLTTEKDWLNLPARHQRDARIVPLAVRVEIDDGDALVELIVRKLGAPAAAR